MRSAWWIAETRATDRTHRSKQWAWLCGACRSWARRGWRRRSRSGLNGWESRCSQFVRSSETTHCQCHLSLPQPGCHQPSPSHSWDTLTIFGKSICIIWQRVLAVSGIISLRPFLEVYACGDATVRAVPPCLSPAQLDFPQNRLLRAQVTPPSLTKDVIRSLHGKSRGQVMATRMTAALLMIMLCCVCTISTRTSGGGIHAMDISPTRSDSQVLPFFSYYGAVLEISGVSGEGSRS